MTELARESFIGRNPFSRTYGQQLDELAEQVESFAELHEAIEDRIKVPMPLLDGGAGQRTFLALITGATASPPDRWLYDFAEAVPMQIPAGPLAGPWDLELLAGGRTGQAINLMETLNDGSSGNFGVALGVQGCPPDGIGATGAVLPLPNDAPVEITPVNGVQDDGEGGTQPITLYYFSTPNPINFACDCP